MGAPTLVGAGAAATGLAATSHASTAIGDLVVIFTSTSTTVTGIPTHTLQGGGTFIEIGTGTVDDGAVDGRLSVAYKIATAAGAQSYQAYTASTGTSQVVAITYLDGTFDVSSLPASAFNSLTTNGAPNPPALTGLTGDFEIFAAGQWNYASSTANTGTAPANYTKQSDGVTQINDLVVCTRSMTGLSSATEDPAAITDNSAPACSIGCTVALKGAVTSQNYTGDVSETVTLSESVGSIFATFAAPNESVSLSEAINGGLLLLADVSEDVGAVGESLASFYTAIPGLADSVSLSEALAGGLALTADVNESVNLSELLQQLYSANPTLGEVVSLSELLTIPGGEFIPHWRLVFCPQLFGAHFHHIPSAFGKKHQGN